MISTQDGWSAFNCAVVKGHPDVVRTMIEYGADINVIEEVSKVTVNYCLYNTLGGWEDLYPSCC